MLQDVQALSTDEREQFIRLLALQLLPDADEATTGERSLAALTESTREEDWSMFYPEEPAYRRRSGQ